MRACLPTKTECRHFRDVDLLLSRAFRTNWVEEAAKLKALEREQQELRQANEILRKASAYFAQAELDRRHKL